jgi:hypothetical protein
VVACDRSAGGGAAPSWSPGANAGWRALNRCPANPRDPNTGLAAFAPGTDYGWLANASWDFIAPPGTRLGALTADMAVTRSGSDQWTIAVVAYDDNVLVPEWRNYGCYSQQACTIPDGFRRVSLNFGGLLGARLTAARWGANPCTASGSGRIAMANAHMTVLDDTRPAISAGGQLWLDGPHVRTDAAVVDASDNVGIRSISILVDGVQKATSASDCQSTQRIPCPNVDDGAISLTGTDVPDGLHTVTVRARIRPATPPTCRAASRLSRRRVRASRCGRPGTAASACGCRCGARCSAGGA